MPPGAVLRAAMNPAAATMKFMDVATLDLNSATCWVSRSGYTGEDGYEISVPADRAVDLRVHELGGGMAAEPAE